MMRPNRRQWPLALIWAMLVALLGGCAPATPAGAPTTPAKPAAAAAPASAGSPVTSGSPAAKSGSTAAALSGEVKIPVIAGTTGPTAPFDLPTRNAIQIAADDINAAGGFNGRKLTFELLDPGSDAAQAATLVRQVGDWAPVLLGPGTTLLTRGAAPVAHELGIPALAVAAVPDLVTSNRPEMFGLIMKGDELAIKAIAGWKGTQPNLSKVAVVIDTKDPSASLQGEGLKKGISDNQMTLVETATYQTSSPDFSAQVTRVKAANPEGVAIAGLSTDVGGLLREIRRQGITAPVLITQAGWTPDTATAAGTAIEGAMTFLEWCACNPPSAAWSAKYEARFNERPNGNALFFADMLNILKKIYDDQKLTGDKANVKAERAAIGKGLLALKNYEGIAGTWSWQENGLPNKTGMVVRHESGKDVLVK